jgi:hypothetical protein
MNIVKYLKSYCKNDNSNEAIDDAKRKIIIYGKKINMLEEDINILNAKIENLKECFSCGCKIDEKHISEIDINISDQIPFKRNYRCQSEQCKNNYIFILERYIKKL